MIAQTLRKLATNRRGTATIELAVATPLLLMMSLAGIDGALGYVHRLQVQQYAQIGADYVMSRMEEVPSNVEIKARVNEGSGVDMSKIKVDRWIECNGSKNSLAACVNAGFSYTQYVSVEVSQDYDPVFSIEKYADFVKKHTSTGRVTLQIP
ncbi:TadE/TadG family type IV pilus assembly protein [Qipengyuania sp. XHP0207]|uniref:TadE/TadG family type IV pilus assembly protein n=1 Tax=Qipengyuania sp. XHP0207 TaxID=3038078 RepID=UPI00241F0CC3|nr:TadE/TadG family type IV pilus assembly protein [Qipengyuania sp. XHP0207]MDG5747534.1 TadE/TadG family type IV pilus assembly protein [Qipengyuania sp. XHP0207]